MTPSTASSIAEHQRRQLRDLNNEHRDTLEALNHAEASIVRARKLNDLNYHKRRKAILANGNGEDHQEELRT
jgi:hypothetical protein